MEPRDATSLDMEGLCDEALLAMITRRQEAALGVIYDRYGRLVYTVALRIIGDRQTAEEVVQDVFQSIWNTAATFQSTRGSFSAWLLGITRHRAIDVTRSKRERARSREHLLDERPLTDSATLDQTVEQRLLREQVLAVLKQLPASQREAIELAYYGGLTRSEIAERLGQPLGTIKTRLRLGLLKLRELVAQHDE